MLVDAKQYQDPLSKLWVLHACSQEFRNWNADPYYNPLAGTSPNIRKEEWVSLVDGCVIGYLCCFVDRTTRSVADISIINFVDDRRFAPDFLTFLKRLRARYRYLRWGAVQGHPSEGFYKRVAEKYGGRIVGTFTKKIKLNDGKLYNETWYEVPCDNRNEAR